MSETDFSDYLKRTHDLGMQQAALEVVTHIRQAVDGIYMQKTYKGEWFPDTLHLNVRIVDRPDGHFPIGVALWYALYGKSLPEQKQLLEQILAPYVENGDMPEFRVEETAGRDDEPHLVIYYHFPL